MSGVVQQQVKTKKRRWAEIALGVASGLMLGVPLLVYSGIRKISGNKLPGISSDIKKGLAIGLAVAVSVFGTVFSGGFAAPTVPAIVAGVLTCAAGIGGVVVVDKRAEEQQGVIQDLKGKVDQLSVQQGGKTMGKSVQQPLAQRGSEQTMRVSDKGSRATSQRISSDNGSVVSGSQNSPQKPRLKFRARQRPVLKAVPPRVARMVKLETQSATIGADSGFSPSYVRSPKVVGRSKGETK